MKLHEVHFAVKLSEAKAEDNCKVHRVQFHPNVNKVAAKQPEPRVRVTWLPLKSNS